LGYIKALSVAPAACMIGGVALAQGYAAGAIKVTNVWTREVPPASKVIAGYMTITNTGAEPDTVVGGSIASAGGFEVHQMETVGGEMKMRQLRPDLDPAWGHDCAQAGIIARHVRRPQDRTKLGQSIKGTLIFAKAGKIDIEYRVERLGARAPDDSGPVSKHGSGHERH
jgi:periplasmic copper chaperone A